MLGTALAKRKRIPNIFNISENRVEHSEKTVRYKHHTNI